MLLMLEYCERVSSAVLDFDESDETVASTETVDKRVGVN